MDYKKFRSSLTANSFVKFLLEMIIIMILSHLTGLVLVSMSRVPSPPSLHPSIKDIVTPEIPAKILHHYSFRDSFVTDLIGGKLWDGFLVGGAYVLDGRLLFSTSDSHVKFPVGYFRELSSFSLEAWMTTGLNIGNISIFRVFDLSLSSGALISVERNNNTGTIILSTYDVDGSHCSGYCHNSTSSSFDDQSNLHLVVTVALGDFVQLFVDGQLVGRAPISDTILPTSLGLYLGSSQKCIAALNGSINEFRVWDGVLSPAEIRRHTAQGPSTGT